MSELIFIVEEAPEGGFTARALGEAIFTEADTMEELRKQVADAVQCHFEPGRAPRLVRLHIVREEILAAQGSRRHEIAPQSGRRRVGQGPAVLRV